MSAVPGLRNPGLNRSHFIKRISLKCWRMDTRYDEGKWRITDTNGLRAEALRGAKWINLTWVKGFKKEWPVLNTDWKEQSFGALLLLDVRLWTIICLLWAWFYVIYKMKIIFTPDIFVIKVKPDNVKCLPSWQDNRRQSIGDREKGHSFNSLGPEDYQVSIFNYRLKLLIFHYHRNQPRVIN